MKELQKVQTRWSERSNDFSRETEFPKRKRRYKASYWGVSDSDSDEDRLKVLPVKYSN